ncbi:hypothetical protein TKK_0012287 [Trichogramma kaykai]|uniref:Uncharacterized protein n=1 Tax=Trichogramma kaykai TaxID=54128 RepID=A0ABD2WN00_9HYME
MSLRYVKYCRCMKKAVRNLSWQSIEFTDGILDIERTNLSECNLVRKNDPPLSPRRWTSEPNVHYIADYDDLCGPWPSPDHPTFKQYDDVELRPTLCTWTFIKIDDVKCMKQNLFDKNAITFIIDKRLPNDNVIFEGKGREVFLNFAWDIFKYMRDKKFSGKGISAVLGLFYLTHRFFLSTPWRTGRDTYDFFQRGLDLHILLKPPESDMIFNFSEYDELLEMFQRLYMEKLELTRLACIPNYHLILKKKQCCRINQ